MGIFLVVVGLSLTALDSHHVGKNIFAGALLIIVGSSFHGLTYVMSEMIMTTPVSSSSLTTTTTTKTAPLHSDETAATKNINQPEPDHLSVRANCAIQGIVATLAFLIWQLLYTRPRLQSLILDPMAEAGTTPMMAIYILGLIALSNLVHSITFFHTLKHFPGGATSAGVLKGLQAVLVFAASSIVLCGRWGGDEMCWSQVKFLSLVVVVAGILLYGAFTTKKGELVKRGTSIGFSMRQKDATNDSKTVCV